MSGDSETCNRVREALSAAMDGEPSTGAEPDVEAHLSTCPGCRGWRAAAHAVTRAVRLDLPSPPRGLDAAIGARLADGRADDSVDRQLDGGKDGAGRGPQTRRRRSAVRWAARAALGLVALLQLAAWAPALALGVDFEAPLHVAHELGAVNVALAAGMVAVAVAPRRAAAMLPVFAVAAALLAVTALGDLRDGATTWQEEGPHLLAAAATGLMLLLRGEDAGQPGERGPRGRRSRPDLAFATPEHPVAEVVDLRAHVGGAARRAADRPALRERVG